MRDGMRQLVRTCLLLAAACGVTTPLQASGHGPLFGAATPVLGRGGWSFDAALVGRSTEDAIALITAMGSDCVHAS